ncbi:MAG: transporter substrate-binding domain-containing protein [Deltaproteobacteria bacterium]|nr:transporter substrate-binding domain-containing protein [Deltaproteobacteria bacterium]
MKKFLFLSAGFLIACWAVISGPSPADAGKLDQIRQRGQLRVGLELGYYPFEYIDAQGRPTGFDVDLAEALAGRLGVKAVLIDLAWKDLIPSLQAGKIDLILSAMTVTPDRTKLVAFSKPYFQTGLSLLLSRQKAPDLTDSKQLNSPKRILAVVADTGGALAAKSYFPAAQVRPLLREIDGVRVVVAGLADALILDQISIWKRHRDFADKTYALLEPFTTENLAAACIKNDQDLLNWLNQFLETFLTSGQYDQLLEKHFSGLGRAFKK